MVDKLAQLKADAKAEGWSDWIRSEADERAMLNGCRFDVAAGKVWVDFFERFLVHTKGEWDKQPFKLLDWQRDDIIMPLFGWLMPDERKGWRRRFSKGDIFVGKKQGKTTLAAGITLGFLMMGGARTEVYGTAFTRDQAGIVYGHAAAMARKSPSLRTRLKPLDTKKRIVAPSTASFYQALAGEAGPVEGIDPLCVIFDEIHVQKTRVLYDALAYATAAQWNSMFLSISTVGVEDHTTIWWEQYEYSKGILEGYLYDDNRFAYIAQADKECIDDPELRRDPAQWKKALPSLGHTVQPDKVRKEVIEAENAPAKLGNLLRYLFNIPTGQATRAVNMIQWKACQHAEADLTGKFCVAGLDIADTDDLIALALFFPESNWLIPHFWIPEDTIARRVGDGFAFYGTWAKSGLWHTMRGSRTDYDQLLNDILEIGEQYNLRQLAYCPWNAGATTQALDDHGWETIKVVQSFGGMNDGCSGLLDAVVAEEIKHPGHPILDWNAANLAVETHYDGAIRPTKEHSAEKIDGMVASMMAYELAQRVPIPRASYYNQNEMA